MSVFTVFRIASAGMTAQRERLEAASANLANAHTTRTAEGGPYRRRDVILETATLEANPNGGVGGAPLGGFTDALAEARRETAVGVRSTLVVDESGAGERRYQPDHPDADASGLVHYPDVDPLEETVNMLSAARSFEANATAFQTAKEMARASLRIGEA
jgi:flagellar basal-body rod protein FlgC